MTELFKCFVFLCVVPAIFGFTDVRDDVLWFKNGQRIKNRFVTGVVNGIVDFDCSDTIRGSNVEGECLSKIECTKSGGTVGGLCSLLGSCCVIERTCHETTSSKLSYFVPPQKPETDCPLTVKIYSSDVCQIRLDFEEFDIAQPTKGENPDADGCKSYQCHKDSFTVEKANRDLGFPHICGNNKGQHIYVPVVENQQEIVIRFKLENRTRSDLSNPNWRIKIRQLECRKTGYDHLNAPSKLMAMHNLLKNKKNKKSDWDLIAPPNCLQYYHNKTGTFESFNYNGGKGPYIGRLNYAICFRKNQDVCRAKYEADGEFQMNYNNFEENRTQEDDKCHPRNSASPSVSQDYIQIPGGVNSEEVHRDFYCNGDLSKSFITSKANGPLYVGVHTDAYAYKNETEEDDGDHKEIGFRIKYQLFAGECDITV